MQSVATSKFWKHYAKLPLQVREAAAKAVDLWKQDHRHPSLHFKKLQGYDDLYSVRIGISWRAVGYLKSDTLYWHWIGHHTEYDQLFG